MYEYLTLTDFPLQCGVVLPEIRLVYQVYGNYNADSFACAKGDHSNVILYPTSYGAQHPDLEWLIRPDGILNPEKYCIINA
jgi:homoserine O-acetyltransferase/O-succinyltransferase